MIILFLIGTLGLGRFVVNSLGLTWHRAEAWSLVLVFGYFFSSWAFLLACSVFGYQAGTAITLTLMLGCWLLPQTRRPFSLVPAATARQTAVWLISTGTLSLVISDLLYRQMLGPGPRGAYSAGGSATDIPLHLSIITNVAYATRFTWHFSLMAHSYLTYHFLIDFLSGMIVRWGGSLRLSLLLTSIPLCLALIQLLFFLGYRVFANVRAGALFAAIFLLGGSNFGFVLAIVHFLHSKSNLWEFFSNPPYDYCNYYVLGFCNFVTNILMPQHSFQIGICVFCAIMLLIYHLVQETDTLTRRRVMFLIGVLAGLLPMAHVHSFLVILMVLIILALFSRKTVGIREWIPAFVISLAFALPQFIYQAFANPHKSFLRFQIGWIFHDTFFPHLSYYTGLFLFILINFGATLFIVTLSYYCLKGYSTVRALILFGAVIFIAGFLFSCEPDIYDNIKFLMYGYLFFCLGIAQYLSQISRAGKWYWTPLTTLFVASGILSFFWQAHRHQLLYSYSDFAEAEELHQRLSPDALALADEYDEHPLYELTGQSMLEGDANFLQSYGFSLDQLNKDVQTIYAGGTESLPLLQKYQVQYIFIGYYERRRYHILNEPFFSVRFPLIYQRNGMDVYQIRRESQRDIAEAAPAKRREVKSDWGGESQARI